jgi:hypothetical protein
MLGRVALERSNVSEERITLIIGVKRIAELGATLAVSSPILFALKTVGICSSETAVLSRTMRRNIHEDGILKNANLTN